MLSFCIDYQYREHALFVGVQLAECRLYFLPGVVWVGSDRHLRVRLLVGERFDRGRPEGASLSAANAAAILINRAKRLKTKGIYFLYRVLQAFGLPALLFYFLFRGLRNGGYWRSLPRAIRISAALV